MSAEKRGLGAPKKLNRRQVLMLVRLYDDHGWKQMDIAECMGITQGLVSQIITGLSYGDITGRRYGFVRSVRHD